MSARNGFYCIVSPEELGVLAGYTALPVLYAYRAAPGPRLLRSCGPAPVGGGLLGLGLETGAEEGNWASLCRQCLLECRSRGATGVLLDWDRFSRKLFLAARALAGTLEQAGMTLLVPEAYAGVSAHALVLVSSALSGGRLELRLKEAVQRYGAQRVVLALERMQEDFRIPAPGQQGRRLSQEELIRLRERRPCIYWSEDLCARYFTYRREDGVHFVLFDDGASLRAKVELAGRLGILHTAAAWREISDCVGTLIHE